MSESVMGAWEHTVVGPDPLPGVGVKGRVLIYSDLPLRYVSWGGPQISEALVSFNFWNSLKELTSHFSFTHNEFPQAVVWYLGNMLFAKLSWGYQVFSVPQIHCPFEKCGSQLSFDHLGSPKRHSDACFGSISIK